jgi:DNA invertase Pin-like site-specific DNA recombinase
MSRQAILYIRVSTATQIDGSGLDRQHNGALSYIAEMGWNLEATISDAGRSAFHAANRAPGSALHKFEMEALQGLHQGKVLVVENLDRLSRQGPKALTRLIFMLNDSGVDVAVCQNRKIFAAENGKDSADDNEAMLNLFEGIFVGYRGKEESVTKSKRGKDLWVKRYANIENGTMGTMAGHAPAWLVVRNGKYVVDEHRGKILNEIFDLYISGVGIFKIIQKLNARGEPSWAIGKRKDKNKGWHLPYVHRLLTKRALLGEYVTLSGETLSRDFFPQAISHDKFNQAQAILTSKAKPRGRDARKMNNLLTGLVVCGVCDGKAGYENKGTNSVTSYTKTNGEIAHYNRKHYERLRCDGNRRRTGCTNNQLFDYKVIEHKVLDLLIEMTIEEQPRSPRVQLLDEEIAKLQNAQVVAQQRRDRILNQLEDEENPPPSLLDRLKLREQEIIDFGKQLKTAARHRDAETAKPFIQDSIEAIANLREQLSSEDDDQRHFARIRVNMVRIPTMPPTYSDLKPPTIPSNSRPGV